MKPKKEDYEEENFSCKSNMELKTQYNIYFEHKMQKLNVLRQFKNSTLEIISYYCEFCDFIVEDKNEYDEHFQIIKHPDEKHSIFCSSCCMFIFGNDTKEHDKTMEHRILLQLLVSIKHVEDLNFFENSLLNEMSLKPLMNKELESDIFYSMKSNEI